MEVGREGVLYTVRYFQVKWLWQQIPFNIILVDNTCTVLIESKPEYSIEPIHCYIKCPFLGLGASFGQFSSNGISFHHELMFAMGLEF